MTSDVDSNTKAKVIAALDGVVEALRNFKDVVLDVLSEEKDSKKVDAGMAMYTELAGVMAKVELTFLTIRKKLMGA